MPRANLSPVALAILCVESAVLADVVNVPDDAPTIQAGIDLAMPGDEVVVADGVYTGAGNFNVDFLGKAITVRSANGPGLCVVDGGGTSGSRGFLFTHGETTSSRLEGFTIRNCVADGAGGGGVFAVNAGPSVSGCLFQNCAAPGGEGGGMMAGGGGALVEACTFLLNTAERGAGLSISGTGNIVRGCSFASNTAGHWGGGAFGRAEFVDCTFLSNRVVGMTDAAGGAIAGSAGTLVLTGCRFESNAISATQLALGGAVAVIDGPSVEATRCLFRASVATATSPGGTALGGAIYNFNARTTIHGCAFVTGVLDATHNSGSAVYHDGLDFGAVNCTAVNNRGLPLDNVSVRVLTVDSQVQLVNCLVHSIFSGCGLAITTIGGETEVRYCSLDCVRPGEGNIFDLPLVTTDGHLLPDSPCIDAGSNSAVPAGLATDLDGDCRFQDDPFTPDTGQGLAPIVDIGADEFAVTACPEDVDGSGVVDFGDVLAVLGAWGPCGNCPEDVNGNGAADFADILAILTAWGGCPR